MEAYGKLVSGSNNKLECLPSEIITEILLRLPVETLLRFIYVCKTFRSLISSRQFTKTHLNFSRNSKNYANHGLILRLWGGKFATSTCSLPSILDNNAHVNPSALYHPAGFFFLPMIYGNCNGLLCVRVDESTLVLYNPTIRKSKTLPGSGTNSSLLTYGLCYHELEDDYRLVEVEMNRSVFSHGVYGVKIYSLRTNSWTQIDDFHCSAFGRYAFVRKIRPGIPLGGLLHWAIMETCCQIFIVDTVTYTHRTLAGPKYDIGCSHVQWGVMDFDGYLGVYHYYGGTRFDIWAMKGSWTKVLSLPYYYVKPWGMDIVNSPLVGLKDGEILVKNRGGCTMIDNSRENSIIRQIGNHDIATMVPSPVYIKSLVAPSFDEE